MRLSGVWGAMGYCTYGTCESPGATRVSKGLVADQSATHSKVIEEKVGKCMCWCTSMGPTID